MIEYVDPAGRLQWHIVKGALVRVWVVGSVGPSFEGKRDSMGHEIPTTRMRCVVPPTKEGSYRMIDNDYLVDDDAVLRATHAHLQTLPADVLAAAQATIGAERATWPTR